MKIDTDKLLYRRIEIDFKSILRSRNLWRAELQVPRCESGPIGYMQGDCISSASRSRQ